MAEITYLEAIREALFEEMERDANVFCLGEDIGKFGGAFKVTEGLQARFGEARVIDMIYTSRLLEAGEALQIGLVSELCDDHAALMQRAHALAAQIAGYAPLTLRATKEILRRLRQAQPRVNDDDIVAKVYTSADFREGLDAFLTKRKPNWTGR